MSAKRIISVYCIIILLLAVLIFRIFDITENGMSTYVTQNYNSFRLQIDKSRGMIYDRNNIPLVETNKKYVISVLPSIESKNYLYSVLPKSKFDEIQDNFSKNVPFTFSYDKYISDSEDVNVYIASDRYASAPLATHFIGYCDASLSQGITGIEKAYDTVLSESSGTLSVRYSVDAVGRSLSGVTPEKISDNYNSPAGVVLTIDSDIQKIAQNAASLIPKNGSVLITDVKTGEILAGVSVPEYDRNNIAASINNNDSSLLNRNLCAYNIGSTFKIVVSAAALSKNISTSFSNNCTGSLKIGNTAFHCHKDQGHGTLDMENAFANSCNPYYIKLGLSVGKERLCSMAANFGIGKPITLCDGISTASGNLPSPSEINTDGDLANISFGQGALMATPVHIAQIINTIANGGYLISPKLVKGYVDKNGTFSAVKTSEPIKILGNDVCDKIKEFMITTVTSGTGRSACPDNLGAGGKTASAETGWKSDGNEMVQAWFSGFYPAKNPKYSIVVLSEAGNSGAASCAPVFKKICNDLYSGGFCK